MWISVKDEPPEENKRVLIYSPYYSENDAMRIRIVDSQFVKILEATHWQPLPEPPGK